MFTFLDKFACDVTESGDMLTVLEFEDVYEGFESDSYFILTFIDQIL